MINLLDAYFIQSLLKSGDAYYNEQGALCVKAQALTAGEINERIEKPPLIILDSRFGDINVRDLLEKIGDTGSEITIKGDVYIVSTVSTTFDEMGMHKRAVLEFARKAGEKD